MTDERKPPSKGLIAGTLISGAAIALATPLIQKWEGRSLDPYRDIVNVMTVCDGETRVEMRRYSHAECDAMTAKAIQSDFGPKVLACTPSLRDRPNQLAAAISLSYNIGIGNYCRSTVARRFNAGDLRGGCNAITMWNKAGGRFVRGLANRREDERRVCLKGL